jgi:cell division protein FtsI/penicillin-binding protein 2
MRLFKDRLSGAARRVQTPAANPGAAASQSGPLRPDPAGAGSLPLARPARLAGKPRDDRARRLRRIEAGQPSLHPAPVARPRRPRPAPPVKDPTRGAPFNPRGGFTAAAPTVEPWLQRVSARRIRLVMGMMGLMAAGLLVQLIRVQFGPYAPVFAARGDVGASRIEEVVPSRGLIYDRRGNLLAANASRYYLEVETRQLNSVSVRAIAEVLSRILVLPLEDLHAQLTTDWAARGQYRIRLTRTDRQGQTWPITVDKNVANVLNGFLADPQAPDLSGLDLVPAPLRVYPAGSLAGHVLGFVNQEDQGYFGIEGYYDEWLSGKSITVERPMIPPEARQLPDPPAGLNLVLTLDLEIQQMVELELQRAIESSGAESGQVIVMDPRNGEILAMAAWPALDPNQYEPWLEAVADQDKGEGEQQGQGGEPVISPAVAAQYEPGSTFKVLTMAAALDAGKVEPDTEFVDEGQIEVGGNLIRNWDGGAWGPQTMLGCMKHSLNVCLAWVAAEKLGAADLYSYLNAFEIGQLTGIDLAGEVPGQLRTTRHPEWTESDLGTNAFGQGVSVTPIQLLTAVGAVANHGLLIQPHLVRQVVGPQGAYSPQPTVLGRPISEETAETLTEMLATTLPGETPFAEVPGYRLAGKTGTAQVPTERGYDPRWTIASFVGWGPLPDVQFIVLVRLDKPESSPWGSVVAAPVFQEVVERLVVLMEIPPDGMREGYASTG